MLGIVLVNSVNIYWTTTIYQALRIQQKRKGIYHCTLMEDIENKKGNKIKKNKKAKLNKKRI